jgi:CheY-like chemotaxis protein
MSTEPLIVNSFERLRFVVIDDDRPILQVVEAFLTAAAAGGVIPAISCLSALNLLADKTKKVDCIICDHSMPTMTGPSSPARNPRRQTCEYPPEHTVHHADVFRTGRGRTLRYGP